MSDFNARFDAAYHAWLSRKAYLQTKPGFYWDNGQLRGEALDPCKLETESIEIYDSPITDFEVF